MKIDCRKYKHTKKEPIGCPEIYVPVCGTNGKTYGNECMLCAEMLSGKKIYLAYKGQCIDCSKYPQPPEGSSIDCPEEYLPVCDANNNTHAHICILCAQIHTTGVKIGINYEGECRKD